MGKADLLLTHVHHQVCDDELHKLSCATIFDTITQKEVPSSIALHAE